MFSGLGGLIDMRRTNPYAPGMSGGYPGFYPTGGPSNMSFGGSVGGFDPSSSLAQLLQAGPTADKAMLDASLSDLDSQKSESLKALKNRFSGLGRSTLSSEYGSQEDQLVQGFQKARQQAQVLANQAGQNRFTTMLSPLMQLLQLMQQQNQFQQSLGAQGGLG